MVKFSEESNEKGCETLQSFLCALFNTRKAAPARLPALWYFRPAKGGILIDVSIVEFLNYFQSIYRQILPIVWFVSNKS